MRNPQVVYGVKLVIVAALFLAISSVVMPLFGMQVVEAGYRDYKNQFEKTMADYHYSGVEWGKKIFTAYFKGYYIEFAGRLFELKTSRTQVIVSSKDAGVVASNEKVTLESNSQNEISILVLRNPFENSSAWRIQMSFQIGGLKNDEINDSEPIFFTFSDATHAGFLVFLPGTMKYFDLGPVVQKRAEWRLQRNILDKRVNLVLDKNAMGQLTVTLDDNKYKINMGGEKIALYNYEIPVWMRYTQLNKLAEINSFEKECSKVAPLEINNDKEFNERIFVDSLTRDFIRFGTVYYADRSSNMPKLEMYNLEITRYP